MVKVTTVKDILKAKVTGVSTVAFKITADTSKADFNIHGLYDSGKIGSSTDSNRVFRAYLDKEQLLAQEVFCVMCLNRANKPIAIFQPFQGGVSSTVADVTIICALAIASLSSSIIVCHNHPSGAESPSDADVRLTQKIRGATTQIGIELLDHIIIVPQSESKYYSFADEGML